MEFWQPASRESLFQRQIAALIRKKEFDWCGEPDRSYVYYDDSTGSTLVLQAIATPTHCFGVFAGMYEESLLPDKSHEKLNQLSDVLQDLSQVLEGVFSRFSTGKSEISQSTPNLDGATVLTAPPTEGAYTNDIVNEALALLGDDFDSSGSDYSPIEVTLLENGE